MKKLLIICVCFLICGLIFTGVSIGAKISDKYKSQKPEKAFLKLMKEHYRNCESKNHLEDFIYLALEARLLSYDLKNVPSIDSVAICPPLECYKFKGGLIKGLSDNLIDKAPYKVIDSKETLKMLKQKDLLDHYSLFLNKLFNFGYIDKKIVKNLGNLFNVEYLLIPRIYMYKLGVDNGLVVILIYSMELNLISVDKGEVEWTLINLVRRKDIEEATSGQIVSGILGYGGLEGSRLEAVGTRIGAEYKELNFIKKLADVILTLGRYNLNGKQGVPKIEREYRHWLRTGKLPR